MRVVVQRVRRASVSVEGQPVGRIGVGMAVLAGIENGDGEQDIEWLAGKLARLRIFDDERGVMNLDVTQAGGEILVVSQFTLHASTRKGNRPSYLRSAPEAVSRPLYEQFVRRLRELAGRPVETGRFGADMLLDLQNDGPVTILIDSRNRE